MFREAGVLWAIALGLVACTTSPYTAERARSVPDSALYGQVFRAVQRDESDAIILVDEAVTRGFIRPAMRDAVLAGRPEIGMTKQEVVSVWYTPLRVNEVIREGGRQEQWVYLEDPYLAGWAKEPRIHERVLYFDDGKLVAIQ